MRFSYTLLIVAFLLLSGCNDKKEESSKVTSKSSGEIKVTEDVLKEKRETQTKNSDGGKFYYSYNKKEDKNEGVEKSYTKLDAYRRVRTPYEKVQISLLANKLSNNFLIHCSACHDDYANGIIGPSLLEKDGNYIYKKLIAFKTKKEKNVLMIELVQQISDEDLKSIAFEIADFNKKVKKLLQK